MALDTSERPDVHATEREIEEEIRSAVLNMVGKDKPVMWSRSAYTHRRTPHVAFKNGAIVKDADFWPLNFPNPKEAVAKTVAAIRSYRDTIDGPVLLTWRIEPEVAIRDDSVAVYVRLCLEPDLWS